MAALVGPSSPGRYTGSLGGGQEGNMSDGGATGNAAATSPQRSPQRSKFNVGAEQIVHNHPAHIPKKCTMVKDRVGCPKTSTHDLPVGNFTYGKPRAPDPENAGDIISNWVTGTPSQVIKSKYMTVYQNILAIKNGCITAKSMREFGKDHPSIHLRESLSDGSARVSNNHEGPFGRTTALSDVSMQQLLQAHFTSYVGDDYDYPDVSAIEDSVAFPRPRPTRASLLQRSLRESAMQEVRTAFLLRYALWFYYFVVLIAGRAPAFHDEEVPKYPGYFQHSANKSKEIGLVVKFCFQYTHWIPNEVPCEIFCEITFQRMKLSQVLINTTVNAQLFSRLNQAINSNCTPHT
jgi:hypothetical protein